eukprot:1329881-Amorphochlora_amoeboformis.AAC.1
MTVKKFQSVYTRFVVTDQRFASQRWRTVAQLNDYPLFEKLPTGQWPKYLWIGCSDSRVPETTILGMKPGDIFVVRNIANQAQRQDIASQAAIAYGVGVLDIPHIVVCGHYGCGGIKAALNNVDHGGPLENWLTYLRDVYRLHKDELDAITDEDAKQRRFVELNVLEQCLNVYKNDVVQSKRVATFEDPSKPFPMPQVHGLIYDISTGNINRLDVDLEKYAEKYSGTYGMYAPTKTNDEMAKERVEFKKVESVEEAVA